MGGNDRACYSTLHVYTFYWIAPLVASPHTHVHAHTQIYIINASAFSTGSLTSDISNNSFCGIGFN